MKLLIAALSFSTVVKFCDAYGRDTRTRVKRIVNGAPELDIKGSEYLAIRYYIHIAIAHCDNKAVQICPPIRYGYRAAGSLLTPFAVQTACHIPAMWNSNGTVVLRNNFENLLISYPSKAFIQEMNEGVLSRNLYYHPRCAQLGAQYSYDFGLIITKSAIEFPGVFYVPLYTLADLAKVWIETQAKRKVCLIIGFGNICQPSDKRSKGSDFMRAGWVNAADYRSCYKRFIHFKFPSYEEADTWICTGAFPGANLTTIGTGDSGGPVSCDNAFAGIISRGGDDVAILASPAFTPLENAAEYRVKFSYAITELYMNDPLVHYHPTGTILMNWNQTSLSNTGSQISGLFCYGNVFILVIISYVLMF